MILRPNGRSPTESTKKSTTKGTKNELLHKGHEGAIRWPVYGAAMRLAWDVIPGPNNTGFDAIGVVCPGVTSHVVGLQKQADP